MRSTIPDLLSAAAFHPEDLAAMQAVFDEACRRRDATTEEHRIAIATVILTAYQSGERDHAKLLDAAIAAAL